MCGIAGFVGAGDESTLKRMGEAIQHRGPDDDGILLRDRVGFAFRRLAIIDTSPLGHQPMESVSRKTAINYNGEIYNYRELREELEHDGYAFRSHSDTEVILALYEKEGRAAFARLRGMFAISLHDRVSGDVYLVRDRMGEKPLYWGIVDGTLLFGSELKALMRHPLWKGTLDRKSLALYLIHEHVPTPRSLFEGVRKLTPGACLTFSHGVATEDIFWTPEPGADHSTVPYEVAKEKLDALLTSSIEEELVADVPVGVLLSGGLDSSTVAYYAQKVTGKVRTFSVAFDEPSFDESSYARSVAVHLGTEHTEERFSAKQCLALIPEVFGSLDEPLADASILPTYLLSSFVQKSVTVALGGDGGDELFAGYPTFAAEGYARFYQALPHFVRAYLIEPVVRLLPVGHGYMSLGFKLNRFLAGASLPRGTRHLAFLAAFLPEELPGLMNDAPLRTWEEAIPPLVDVSKLGNDSDRSHNALLVAYQRTYLIDQVLVKVDRASMMRSLETRAPFLDRRIVEFVNSLPYAFKWHSGVGKRILKDLMRTRLPGGIADRAKKGFGIPMAKWLTEELRPLAEQLLAKEKVEAQGLFKSEAVSLLLEEHLSGARDHHKKLWTLMVFMLWYDSWHTA